MNSDGMKKIKMIHLVLLLACILCNVIGVVEVFGIGFSSMTAAMAVVDVLNIVAMVFGLLYLCNEYQESAAPYRKPRKTPPKRFRPSHTGRMDSLRSLGGDISGPLSFSVLRIFLVLYILLQCFQCDATYRGRIVTRTPKRVSGKLFLYLGQVIPTRNSGRNAL